jgi:3-polyprenyl-4-hydroxybenzoate decarboxylase
VPRGHGHADAVLATTLDVLQQPRKTPVVHPNLVVLLHVLTEGNQIIPKPLYPLALSKVVDDLVKLCGFLIAQLVDILQQQVDLLRGEVFRVAFNHHHPLRRSPG